MEKDVSKTIATLIEQIRESKYISAPNDLKGVEAFETFRNQKDLKQSVVELITYVEQNGKLAREKNLYY